MRIFLKPITSSIKFYIDIISYYFYVLKFYIPLISMMEIIEFLIMILIKSGIIFNNKFNILFYSSKFIINYSKVNNLPSIHKFKNPLIIIGFLILFLSSFVLTINISISYIPYELFKNNILYILVLSTFTYFLVILFNIIIRSYNVYYRSLFFIFDNNKENDNNCYFIIKLYYIYNSMCLLLSSLFLFRLYYTIGFYNPDLQDMLLPFAFLFSFIGSLIYIDRIHYNTKDFIINNNIVINNKFLVFQCFNLFLSAFYFYRFIEFIINISSISDFSYMNTIKCNLMEEGSSGSNQSDSDNNKVIIREKGPMVVISDTQVDYEDNEVIIREKGKGQMIIISDTQVDSNNNDIIIRDKGKGSIAAVSNSSKNNIPIIIDQQTSGKISPAIDIRPSDSISRLIVPDHVKLSHFPKDGNIIVLDPSQSLPEESSSNSNNYTLSEMKISNHNITIKFGSFKFKFNYDFLFPKADGNQVVLSQGNNNNSLVKENSFKSHYEDSDRESISSHFSQNTITSKNVNKINPFYGLTSYEYNNFYDYRARLDNLILDLLIHRIDYVEDADFLDDTKVEISNLFVETRLYLQGTHEILVTKPSDPYDLEKALEKLGKFNEYINLLDYVYNEQLKDIALVIEGLLDFEDDNLDYDKFKNYPFSREVLHNFYDLMSERLALDSEDLIDEIDIEDTVN